MAQLSWIAQVYKATAAAKRPLRVYLIVAPASADEQRFLSAIRKERVAFERLIHEKAHMAAPLLQAQPTALAAAGEASGRKSDSGSSGAGADKWGITAEGTRGSSAQSAVATLLGPRGVARYQLAAGQSAGVLRPLTVDLAGVADMGRRVVVADLREFRAKLPFRLYNAGGLAP